MFRETLLILAGVLVSLRLLYEFRSVSFLGDTLSTFVALILIYVPFAHISLRKIPVAFFEKTASSIRRSFALFFKASLALFPPFLILNHFYQEIFFGNNLRLAGVGFSLEAVLVQILLIALPEEFFFRGYLQTLLSRRFHRRISLFGSRLLSVSVAVPLTSLLFAFSHTWITLRWWHFAIFFPSLVFGWLRERSRGLIAPVFFHAASNVLVAWIGMAYR